MPLSQLRLLTITHWGFDGKEHTGQLVVNGNWAKPLASVFRKLHELRFPIRHMRLDDMYGPRRALATNGDVTGSLLLPACRSLSLHGRRSKNWSNHAYGHAIDVNPVENPYVGCGQTRDPTSVRYMDRSRHRKGMVTPAVVRAFRSIGWGWGGEWSGETKDYMHFSTTGHWPGSANRGLAAARPVRCLRPARRLRRLALECPPVVARGGEGVDHDRALGTGMNLVGDVRRDLPALTGAELAGLVADPERLPSRRRRGRAARSRARARERRFRGRAPPLRGSLVRLRRYGRGRRPRCGSARW